MSDRKDSYFRQLVDEAFFDACFDDLEAADRALAVDMGFIGIVSGGTVTQHSPTADLTVDVSGPCVGYDQAGRRMLIPASVSGFNCAVDENSASTAVGTPGNERWLSLQLRFDRTLASPQTDGNGLTVYTDQDESYELAIVMAGEYSLGTNNKPALPTDGRLLCDIKLIYGQTQILNADIYVDRRQDFSIFSAASIPVSSGGWSFLSPATDDVQATFDFIDGRMVQRDGSGEILHNLIPDAAARDLGSSSKPWDLYLRTLTTDANTRVAGHLLPGTTGNNLGENSTPLEWSLYADLIELSGDFKPAAAARVDGHLLPKSAANDLGSASLPWDLYLRTLTTDASSRITGNLLPTASSQDLGSASLQWDIFTQIITMHKATVAGALVFSAAKSFDQELDLAGMLAQSTWTATDWQWVRGASVGGRSISGWHHDGSGADVGDIQLDLPHGITLTDLLLTWWEEGAAAGVLSAQLYQVDYQGAETTKSGVVTITATGSWQDKQAMAISDFVVDRIQYKYILRITGSNGKETALTGIGLTSTFTDLALAAI